MIYRESNKTLALADAFLPLGCDPSDEDCHLLMTPIVGVHNGLVVGHYAIFLCYWGPIKAKPIKIYQSINGVDTQNTDFISLCFFCILLTIFCKF